VPFVLKKLSVPKRQRAVLFLMKELSYSQKEAQSLIGRGRLLVNGNPVAKSAEEIEGDVEIIVFEPLSRGLNPLVVEEEFVVFEKPSGVLIHPQNRNTEYSLIDELKSQFGPDANIAHRIDQETSGLVLCGRNKQSERDLKMMFENRKIGKKYLAMVHGKMEKEMCVDAPLLRENVSSAKVRMLVKVDKNGKDSLTDFKPLKYFPQTDTTLVECSPVTGRQHQIRAHLFHVKHPIVGDPVYGQSEENLTKYLDRELSHEQRIDCSGSKRLLLHANQLSFELYEKNYTIISEIDFETICFLSMQR
jgi:23S rRNA pseudouridine1911/1915/1917 synthase